MQYIASCSLSNPIYPFKFSALCWDSFYYDEKCNPNIVSEAVNQYMVRQNNSFAFRSCGDNFKHVIVLKLIR